jgi:hypothetical protein
MCEKSGLVSAGLLGIVVHPDHYQIAGRWRARMSFPREDLKTKSYIANLTSAFSLRPEVYRAWQNLLSSIRSKMRLRRYELVTLAAAFMIDMIHRIPMQMLANPRS